jgi:hypothetical protein
VQQLREARSDIVQVCSKLHVFSFLYTTRSWEKKNNTLYM